MKKAHNREGQKTGPFPLNKGVHGPYPKKRNYGPYLFPKTVGPYYTYGPVLPKTENSLVSQTGGEFDQVYQFKFSSVNISPAISEIGDRGGSRI